MTRRNLLRRLGTVFLASLAGVGIYCAASLLPRPPRKVFLKEKDFQGKKLLVGEDFFLVHQGEKILAFSRTCPHLGCRVTYDPGKKIFICPCHQSRFALTGKYLAGPAKKDLRPLKIQKTEGGYILEIPA